MSQGCKQRLQFIMMGAHISESLKLQKSQREKIWNKEEGQSQQQWEELTFGEQIRFDQPQILKKKS